MNPHTMAALIGQGLVLNSVVAELVALLTPEQRALLRERLREHAQDVGQIDEFEPDCSDYQRAQFAEWDDSLAPKP
jgi:hypothetical protein